MQIIANEPVADLDGSPFEQGRQLGRSTTAAIRQNVEVVRKEREAVIRAGVSEAAYDEALGQSEEYVASVSSETLEEIRGVAEGAAIPYADLLDLNLMAYFPMRRLVVECSQLMIGPARADEGRWFLAKTRDLPATSLRQSVVRRRYEDGTELAEVIHSGAVTSPGSGLNDHGLSLSTSGVWPRVGRYRLRDAGKGWNLVNPHLLLRHCHTVDEVEEALNRTSRLTGMNIVAADGNVGARLEVIADAVVRTELTDGHAVLTNHCPSPQLKGQSPSREEYPSTFDRYDRLSALAESNASWTEDAVWRAMSDHDGMPNSSVCRHPDPRSPDSSITAYASVATLPEQVFRVAIGLPCVVTTSATSA